MRELLKVMARNQALDIFRSEHRQRRNASRQVEFPEEGLADANTPSPQARLERLELIEQLLQSSSFDQQVLRRLMSGQPLSEIAAELGTSVKTIRRHYSFIQNLRRRMDSAEKYGDHK